MKYPFSKKQTLIGGSLSLFAFILYYGLWGRGTINNFIWKFYEVHNANRMCLRAIEKYNQVIVDERNQYYESALKGELEAGVPHLFYKPVAAWKTIEFACFDKKNEY